MELFKASRQWATRPADERFSSVREMYDACKAYAAQAAEATVQLKELRVEAVNNDVQLIGRNGTPAQLTHWAFGQMAKRIGAPAGYLRELDPELAARCVNAGIQKVSDTYNPNVELLFHQNGSLMLRALTSSKYQRIWNYEVAERLLPMIEEGWQVPPAMPAFEDQPGVRPATEADVLNAASFSRSIQVGDMIAPAGLYASDHDMFAFLVFEKNRIDDGTPEGLARGVFFENGEVGEKSIKRTTFLYRFICKNHIVWGAEKVSELKVRHVGDARKRFQDFAVELKQYADSSASDDEARIKSARRKVIAATKEQVLDAIFKLRIPELSQKMTSDAYDVAEQHVDVDGPPTTVWGMTQGLTRLSQATPHADTRTKLDRAAGKILRIAF
jgi:hypothetical protein